MLSGTRRRAAAAAVALAACLIGLVSYSNQSPVVYYTVDGLEPDKWASAWLLSQRVESGAVIEVRPRWALSGSGIPFDIPGEPLYRKDGLTTFQVIAENSSDDLPHVSRLGGVLSDLELNAWAKNEFPETAAIERHYRALQQRFNRNNVPLECYLAFFDRVAAWMKAGNGSMSQLEAELESFVTTCRADSEDIVVDRRGEYVPTVAISTILERVAAGSRVVFVDTREPDEYREGRIPGAINLPLRDLDEYPEHLKDADLVISYCVKDFRGYEVAQDLLESGVRNAVIMEPYGIKGWSDVGLPVVSGPAGDRDKETELLRDCALDARGCRAASETEAVRS